MCIDIKSASYLIVYFDHSFKKVNRSAKSEIKKRLCFSTEPFCC